MAEEDEGVRWARSRPPEGAVRRRDRQGVDAGQPQEEGTLVGGMPARAGADYEDAAAGQSRHGRLDRLPVGQDAAQLGRLAGHRLGHLGNRRRRRTSGHQQKSSRIGVGAGRRQTIA